MFAVIKTGGKQYFVSKGDKIDIEKIEKEEGDMVEFNEVLLAGEGDKVSLGKPLLENAKVKGKVLKQGREDKKTIFKYKPKKRYKKTIGHRQPFTQVEIAEISY